MAGALGVACNSRPGGGSVVEEEGGFAEAIAMESWARTELGFETGHVLVGEWPKRTVSWMSELQSEGRWS